MFREHYIACFSFSFYPIASLQLSIRKLMVIGTTSFLSKVDEA